MINRSSINNFLQIFDKGKLSLLNLKAGQIIKGEILDLIKTDQAIVSIKGHKVLAKLEMPLSKGQKSFFLVTSTGSEVKLKLLTEKNQPNQVINTTDELLKELGIKNTILNKKVINALMKNQLPVEKSIIDTVAKLITENKDFQLDQTLSITKMLNDKNLKITPENIKAVSEFMKSDGLLNKLDALKQTINESISVKEQETAIPKEVKHLLVDTKRQIEELHTAFSLDQNENEDSDVIKMQNNNANSKNDTAPLKIDSNKILQSIKKFITETQQSSLKDTTNEQVATLKSNLEKLFIQKDNLPKNLFANIDKSIQHIAGQHLLLSNEQPVFQQTLVQLPSFAPFLDKPVFVQVHSKNSEEKKLNQDDMHFVFLFQLKKLGDTMVDMRVLNKQIFFHLFNDNKDTENIINQLEKSFIDFITDKGFQTTGISVKPMANKKKFDTSSITASYSGVDIKI